MTMTIRRSPLLLLLPFLGSLAACNGAGQANGGPQVTGEPAGRAEGTETAFRAPVPPGSLTAERLKGLSSTQVEGALGAPSFRRRDPPAEVWQYRTGACTLDLFLYESGAERVVAHYAVRNPGGGPVITDGACLDAVLARGRQSPTS